MEIIVEGIPNFSSTSTRQVKALNRMLSASSQIIQASLIDAPVPSQL